MPPLIQWASPLKISRSLMIPPYVTAPVAIATNPKGRMIRSMTLYTALKPRRARLDIILGIYSARKRPTLVFWNQPREPETLAGNSSGFSKPSYSGDHPEDGDPGPRM